MYQTLALDKELLQVEHPRPDRRWPPLSPFSWLRPCARSASSIRPFLLSLSPVLRPFLSVSPSLTFPSPSPRRPLTFRHFRQAGRPDSEEAALKKEIGLNIQRLKDIRCYRGLRHEGRYPCRGQRTKTNAQTRRRMGRLN